MVVPFNTFNIIIFCCKDTSFIFVTRWLHMVADLSLSNRLFKIYTFTHSVIYLHIIHLLFNHQYFCLLSRFVYNSSPTCGVIRDWQRNKVIQLFPPHSPLGEIVCQDCLKHFIMVRYLQMCHLVCNYIFDT